MQKNTLVMVVAYCVISLVLYRQLMVVMCFLMGEYLIGRQIVMAVTLVT